MLRRGSAVLALLVVVVTATAAAACDTGDGRELRPPTASERAAMPTTTTTTTPLPSLPLDVINDTTTTSAVTSTTSGLPTTTAPGTFGLQAPDLAAGVIDVRFTCDGEGRSPLLLWTAPPVGTIELALVVTDDNANGFVHWAVSGIPPTAGEVGEGATITGASEGLNGFNAVGWDGPCPHSPGETHTYRFSLYALGQQTELPENFSGAELLSVASSTAIGYADLTATYTRAG